LPPPNPSPLLPSAERLQEIRDTDTASGEDLQFCPAAWQHRRQLLAYIDTLTASKPPQTVGVLCVVTEDASIPVGVYTTPALLAEATKVHGPDRQICVEITVDAAPLAAQP
jgi:hypothetical protein